MEARAQELGFSSNEEMDSYRPGDDCISLSGYVDNVENLKEVGQGSRKFSLFKCIVNNAMGRRIKVSFWGKEALKWSSVITRNKVINVLRPVCGKEVDPNYQTPGIIPHELSSQAFTTISMGETFHQESELEAVQTVELRNISEAEGTVRVIGYLKVTFDNIIAKGSYTYGCGAITDGQYKLIVHIAQFEKTDVFAEGCHLSIQGESKLNANKQFYIFHVKTMSQILIIDDNVLSENELNDGFPHVNVPEHLQSSKRQRTE